MIKSLCIYVAGILLTLYCFFLYDDTILGALLAAEILYLAVASAEIQRKYSRIQIHMEPMVPIAEKNQSLQLRVTVRNDLRVGNAYVRVGVQIENTFTGEKRRCVLEGDVPAKGQEVLCASFSAGACGVIRITTDRCRVYDALHLLCRAGKGNQIRQVGVMPECHLIAVEVTRRTREFLADAEEYSDRESGDDPAEVYQIREYREKDSIHDIHWKLSAKAEELLVKEHARPLGPAVLIWLNLCESTGKKSRRERFPGKRKRGVPENMPEMAASLSFSLLNAECVHVVAWYEPENHRVRKKLIRKEEHIYELLNRLLFVKACRDAMEMQAQYEEAFRGEQFSTKVEIRMDGTVSIGEELVAAFDGNTPIQWDDLYFMV